MFEGLGTLKDTRSSLCLFDRVAIRRYEAGKRSFWSSLDIPYVELTLPIALINALGLSTAPGVFVFIAMMATLFMGLRFLFSRLIQGKQRKAQQLLARLEQIVAEPATEATPTPLPEATARLDASLLTEEAEPEEAPTQARIRGRASS